MGFWLTAANGEQKKINVWHWKATLALLVRTGVIDQDLAESASYNGEAEFEAATASRIADFLDFFLVTLADDERVYITGERNTEPFTTTLYRGDEVWRNYSTDRGWLSDFRDFSKRSSGFVVT